MATTSAQAPTWRQEISPYQWAVLVATTLGWALDGFDSSLFTQIAGPATTERPMSTPPSASG